jgi:hypothetical protein
MAQCVCVCMCACTCRHAHNLTITESPNTSSISFYLHAWKLPSTLPPFVRKSSLYIISVFPQVFNLSQFVASYLFIVYVMTSSVVHTIQDQMVLNNIGKNKEGSSCDTFPCVCLKGLGKRT